MFGWECQWALEQNKNREPCGSLFVLYDDLAVGTVDGEILRPHYTINPLADRFPLLLGSAKVNLF